MRYFLNGPEDVQSVTNWGRLLHARGTATAKARSAIIAGRVAGTTGRTRMSTGDDGVRLQRQAGWRLVSSMAPYCGDCCIQERTTCRLCVQVQAASADPSATAWRGRIYALRMDDSHFTCGGDCRGTCKTRHNCIEATTNYDANTRELAIQNGSKSSHFWGRYAIRNILYHNVTNGRTNRRTDRRTNIRALS